VEGRYVAVVPPLRHSSHVASDLLVLGIDVQIKMLGGKDPELEILVVDLVTAEILRVGANRKQARDQCATNQKLPGTVVRHRSQFPSGARDLADPSSALIER